MIKRLLKVRKDALVRFEISDDFHNRVALIQFDKVLGLLVFWFVGSCAVLGIAIYSGSLQAFAGFILSAVACALVSVPILLGYLKKYEVEVEPDS